MNKEPIVLGLAPAIITGIIAALANGLRAFNIVDLNQAQLDALNGIAVATMLLLATLGAWWARQHSTPTSNPTLDEGTVVTVVTPPGQPNHTTTV